MKRSTLLRLGSVGPVLFIVVFLIEGATRTGYSAYRNYVSQLSLGPGGGVQVANFLVDGALTMLLAWGLLRALDRKTTGVLIALNGVALVIAGLFATDPGLGYPPGVPTAQTTLGQIHAMGGLLAFTTLGAAGIVFSRVATRRGWPRAWSACSLASGILVLGLFVASAVSGSLAEAGSFPNAPVGLLQRGAVLLGNTWLVATAWKLARDPADA